jgi:hypothetical protein
VMVFQKRTVFLLLCQPSPGYRSKAGQLGVGHVL